MSLRLLRAFVPTNEPEVELQLRGLPGVEFVEATHHEDRTTLDIVVGREGTESAVSLLEARWGHHDEFRVLILALEGTVPVVQPEEPVGEGDKETPPLNVEELYEDVRMHAQLDWVYVISIAIASLVAATGLVRDSTELVVASMILAPLLGPNIALATATALGDLSLGRRAALTGVVGLGISILVGVLMGVFYEIPLEASMVDSRLQVGLLDFVVAGTAGVAGGLAYTSGAFGRVVGVMIAVALLPPAVLTGMLLGGLDFDAAIGPALVTGINFIGINLCSVLVLVIQNVRPRRIYEQERAKKAVLASVLAWSVMLVVLVGLVVLAGVRGLW